jgi:hypothetical protein
MVVRDISVIIADSDENITLLCSYFIKDMISDSPLRTLKLIVTYNWKEVCGNCHQKWE